MDFLKPLVLKAFPSLNQPQLLDDIEKTRMRCCLLKERVSSASHLSRDKLRREGGHGGLRFVCLFIHNESMTMFPWLQTQYFRGFSLGYLKASF